MTQFLHILGAVMRTSIIFLITIFGPVMTLSDTELRVSPFLTGIWLGLVAIRLANPKHRFF